MRQIGDRRRTRRVRPLLIDLPCCSQLAMTANRSEMLEGKSIILGVSGGVAAYKAAALASLLVQSGAHVEVVLTAAASRFIQPLTFAAITHSPIHSDPFMPWKDEFTGHVSLAEHADAIVVAPATAATIARLAIGLADDLLALVVLGSTAPLVVAPAMEAHMFLHPATQANLEILRSRGATIVGPDHGRLASGGQGVGRLATPELIVQALRDSLERSGALRGRRIVVTAGGTREPIDPVRFIGNRSSGRMGYAIARAAQASGASVTLISGPSSLTLPSGVTVIHVETALQMKSAVEQHTLDADAIIMAAAVADYRAAQTADQKIKKEPGVEHLNLTLVRNPDIIAELNRPGLLKIGFAAETDDLLTHAQAKLHNKHLAMIVANDAESTIGAEESTATLLFAHGEPRALPRMSKDALAAEIVRVTAELLSRGGHRAW